jgi:hypothetical protein
LVDRGVTTRDFQAGPFLPPGIPAGEGIQSPGNQSPRRLMKFRILRCTVSGDPAKSRLARQVGIPMLTTNLLD